MEAELSYEEFHDSKNLSCSDDLCQIADSYYFGTDRKQDLEKARTFYEGAATLNSARAQFFVGNQYYSGGQQEAKNVEIAIEWFEKSALQDYLEAEYILGYIYLNEKEFEDLQKAKYWLLKSCKNQFEDNYMSSSIPFLTTHEGKVYNENRWLQLVAESAYYLGELYSYYEELTNNVNALRWYTEAAKKGHVKAIMECRTRFLQGIGTEKNSKQAFRYTLQLANYGIPEEQIACGDAYFVGNGIKKDYIRALEWYEKAAHLDNRIAQQLCGFLYYDGIYVMQDKIKSAFWFEKAEENCDINITFDYVTYLLGKMYYDGDGVKKDKSKALYYFKKLLPNRSFFNYKTVAEWVEQIENEKDSSTSPKQAVNVKEINSYSLNVIIG